MAKRKQARSSRHAGSSTRARQTRTPIADGQTASVRKPSKPPPAEPFHVVVDRQLKSGHETYDAAEKVALGIKRRYPKLYVTVFDAKERRHTLIELPSQPGASDKNRVAEQGTQNAFERHKVTAIAGGKHWGVAVRAF